MYQTKTIEMKLKVGDKVIENDGISIIVYTIIKVDGKRAIAKTEFEGKTYFTAYKTRYWSDDNIHPWIEKRGTNDLTIRRLAKE